MTQINLCQPESYPLCRPKLAHHTLSLFGGYQFLPYSKTPWATPALFFMVRNVRLESLLEPQVRSTQIKAMDALYLYLNLLSLFASLDTLRPSHIPSHIIYVSTNILITQTCLAQMFSIKMIMMNDACGFLCKTFSKIQPTQSNREN